MGQLEKSFYFLKLKEKQRQDLEQRELLSRGLSSIIHDCKVQSNQYTYNKHIEGLLVFSSIFFSVPQDMEWCFVTAVLSSFLNKKGNENGTLWFLMNFPLLPIPNGWCYNLPSSFHKTLEMLFLLIKGLRLT